MKFQERKNYRSLVDDNWNSFPCIRMPWKTEIIVEKDKWCIVSDTSGREAV